MNHYPAWKYLLLVVVVAVGILYALPNLYGEDPAIQIQPMRGAVIDDVLEGRVQTLLDEGELALKSTEMDGTQLLVRFNDTATQLAAADLIRELLGPDYIVALNLAPTTPAWLESLNARPMYLGLDLRGGVHFLMEVDMDAAIQKAIERYGTDLRTVLRKGKVRYISIRTDGDRLVVKFRNAEDRQKGADLIHDEYRDLVLKEVDEGDSALLQVALSENEIRDTRKLALQQNITKIGRASCRERV